MKNRAWQLILVLVVLTLICVTPGCRRKNANANNANADAGKQSLVPPGLDAPGYFNLGMDATKNDRDEQAAAAFEHAIALQPEYPEAHLRLGMSYDVLGRTEEANEQYKLAIQQYKAKVSGDTKEATDWFNLGLAYSKLRRHDEAVGAFYQATKLNKEYAEAYYELGDSLIRIARYGDAINALKKAIELDPDNYQAKDALVKAQEGQQRMDADVKNQLNVKNKNKNANTPGNGNSNTGNSGGNSSRPRPKPTPNT